MITETTDNGVVTRIFSGDDQKQLQALVEDEYNRVETEIKAAGGKTLEGVTIIDGRAKQIKDYISP